MRLVVVLIVLAIVFALTFSSYAEEPFPGQKGLSALLKAAGGFEGKIFLSEQKHSNGHAVRMYRRLTESVPEKNIVVLEEIVHQKETLVEKVIGYNWGSNYYEEGMRKHSVRVVHNATGGAAVLPPFMLKNKARILKEQDILVVYAAGNSGDSPGEVPYSDIYHPNDPYWGSSPVAGIQINSYEVVEGIFKSNHAIMVNYCIKKPATFEEFSFYHGGEKLREEYQSARGEHIRHPSTVGFGSLKEYGFSVIHSSRSLSEGKVYPLGSSSASAHASGFAFYLFQLWDTTAEVLEVMRETAIDIGEPGVDKEFGWGILNADHPIIWNRAIEKLEESLEMCLIEDVALEQAITAPTAAKKGFDLFYDIGDDKREIGVTFAGDKTKVAFATGSTIKPFGLSSRFLQQSTIAQVGLQYAITDTVSVSGIYGRNSHEDLAAHKGSIGLGYQRNFSEGSGNLSVYAGHRAVWGSLGIPGYRVMDIPKTPFSMRMVEVRTSFNYLF